MSVYALRESAPFGSCIPIRLVQLDCPRDEWTD